MGQITDFYQVMGVDRSADGTAIKKAYRQLVKECHPDTHPGDRQAEERFKQIAEAYAVLSDEEKRKQYDQKLAEESKRYERISYGRKVSGQPFDPADFRKEFESLFSFGGQTGEKTERKGRENGKEQRSKNKNPLDMSDFFEKYMGFK